MKTYLNSFFIFVTIIVGAQADHSFTFKNNCGANVQPVIANVNCGYSPRCDIPGSGGVPLPAISYMGPQPESLEPGGSQTLMINRQWNGRIFAQNGTCGDKGEGCTITEFNLDTGFPFIPGKILAPQDYDISNRQGFTQSISIAVNGCDTVTCTSVNCGCSSAYPPGGFSGCGGDSPDRKCSAGGHSWTITFCP